jgi:hypothetical protein
MTLLQLRVRSSMSFNALVWTMALAMIKKKIKTQSKASAAPSDNCPLPEPREDVAASNVMLINDNRKVSAEQLVVAGRASELSRGDIYSIPIGDMMMTTPCTGASDDDTRRWLRLHFIRLVCRCRGKEPELLLRLSLDWEINTAILPVSFLAGIANTTTNCGNSG